MSRIIDSGIGDTLSLTGGAATTSDFTLSDAIPNNPGGAASYNPATGLFSATMPAGDDQGLMIGSTSLETVTSLTITGSNGPDGWTTFFGVTTASVPEPSSIIPGGLACLIGLGVTVRRREPTA